jgi:hypothetical protein
VGVFLVTNLREKKSKSRFTEITTKIEDWKLKFAIFENFTNHGESRVTRIKKNTTVERTRTTPITDHGKKWWKKEKKCMRGSEKGS